MSILIVVLNHWRRTPFILRKYHEFQSVYHLLQQISLTPSLYLLYTISVIISGQGCIVCSAQGCELLLHFPSARSPPKKTVLRRKKSSFKFNINLPYFPTNFYPTISYKIFKQEENKNAESFQKYFFISYYTLSCIQIYLYLDLSVSRSICSPPWSGWLSPWG